MTIGDRIKEARKSANGGKGMTQRELGEACGINEANIRKYENGRQNPKFETLQKIANVLGCDAYWLRTGKNPAIQDKAASDVMKMFCTDDSHIEKAAKLAAFYAENQYRENGYSFSNEEKSMILIFSQLNEKGKQKAIDQISDLAKIPDYQKDKAPQNVHNKKD